MTGTTHLDIAPSLLQRIRRVAAARGWAEQAALAHMLERGLVACESELAASFDDADEVALKAAINAMQDVPDDSGFGRIGQLASESAG